MLLLEKISIAVAGDSGENSTKCRDALTNDKVSHHLAKVSLNSSASLQAACRQLLPKTKPGIDGEDRKR